jgi:hypothetical protein
MASRRVNIVAGLVGVSAGLSAYLPSFVCAGAPCSSCFACVGAGGAAASALIVGFVSRKFGAGCRRDNDQANSIRTGGTAEEELQ